MSRPRRNLRLFVAMYPPPDLAPALLRLAEDCAKRLLEEPDAAPSRAGDRKGYRMVPAEQVHLTLQFVGDVPVRGVDDVQESVERSAAGLRTCTVTPRALITLPKRGRARLIALETDAPATMLEIKRRLAARLARDARAKSDDRFLPHLTVCRFRSPRRVDVLDEPIALPAFPFDEIKLMRSELGHGGARHHEIAAYPLETGRQ